MGAFQHPGLPYFPFNLAEGVGFEPTLATRARTVFKTVSINRSDTPPRGRAVHCSLGKGRRQSPGASRGRVTVIVNDTIMTDAVRTAEIGAHLGTLASPPSDSLV